MIADYIKSAVSIVVAAPFHLSTLFWPLSSYIVILLAFLEFIIWNGGVVLGTLYSPLLFCPFKTADSSVGDKDNHIASIHLAQMLYIWPYFVFFSLPILYPFFLNLIIRQEYLPPSLRIYSLRYHFPRAAIAIPCIAVMLAIVRYNTIVHPFTLADNRHYMFYVFRILLRHPIIKYLAVPIYFAAAWACLTTLGYTSLTELQVDEQGRRMGILAHPDGNRSSFVLVWLVTTAISLCTAPLVEPRYLIVPWLIWRLHIKSPTPIPMPVPPQRAGAEADTGSKLLGKEWWLWQETIWFSLINLATGYIFLYRGFAWPQEPGMVQRFMW